MYNFRLFRMLLISALLFSVFAIMYWYKRPTRFPDGPSGLPFVGIIPWIGEKNMGEVLMKYQKDYGQIFSVRMGRDDWVVLNNFEDLQETLVRRGASFSGRPSNPFMDALTNRKGLVFLDYGPYWKSQRKFGINTLRRFGIGKRSMEGKIEEETSHLTNEFLKKSSKPFDPRKLLTNAVSNVICNILHGKRYDYEDKTFKMLIYILNESFSGDQSKILVVFQFAFWLRHFPYFRQYYRIFQEDITFVMDALNKSIKNHQETYDENDTRDFIDSFIKEMKAGTDPSFEFEQLAQYLRDLFEAGSETTSTALVWCILCLLHYPEHQEKIYSEIEHVIGSSNPSMKHQPDMPYTAAFIQEIMRHRTIKPVVVMHKTNQSVQFKGYTIPKDTTIIPNIWAVHFDPKLFKNPKDFNPQRFIDKEGKFVKNPHVIPFGIGPRQCLGMQLANMEIFIFLTTLVQQFEILPPKDEKIPLFHEGNFGFSYAAKPFKAIFNPRK